MDERSMVGGKVCYSMICGVSHLLSLVLMSNDAPEHRTESSAMYISDIHVCEYQSYASFTSKCTYT